MKNFVFISPNFPTNYWKFCAELKNNGLRVLGIGDCPYDNLSPELRASLDEYFKVSSLENYDEVFRAVAFFTYKYGSSTGWKPTTRTGWSVTPSCVPSSILLPVSRKPICSRLSTSLL